jgi:hypothetical protein
MTTTKKKPLKRTGRKTKEQREKIIQQIQELIVSGEKAKYTNIKLAAKVGIDPKTLGTWLDEIYSGLPTEKAENIFHDINAQFKFIKSRLLRLHERAIQEDNPKAELLIMREMRDTIKDFTKILEDFHIKPKAIDFHAIKTDSEAVTEEWLLEIAKEDDDDL